MPRTEFIATGFHVPERVVTNDDLAQLMDTSDDWITQRSGIKTRHWVSDGETGVTLAREASCRALANARMEPSDLDCIVYCTCTPDHFEPGNGVFLERELGLTDIPAIDVRNQCSGFIYGLSVADAWIRIGQYRRILLVGAEVHSRGLDRTTRGRDTAVLFGGAPGELRAVGGRTHAPPPRRGAPMARVVRRRGPRAAPRRHSPPGAAGGGCRGGRSRGRGGAGRRGVAARAATVRRLRPAPRD